MRSWVAARCDPYKDPIPPIPPQVIVLRPPRSISDAFETITGEPFVPPPPGAAAGAHPAQPGGVDGGGGRRLLIASLFPGGRGEGVRCLRGAGRTVSRVDASISMTRSIARTMVPDERCTLGSGLAAIMSAASIAGARAERMSCRVREISRSKLIDPGLQLGRRLDHRQPLSARFVPSTCHKSGRDGPRPERPLAAQ